MSRRNGKMHDNTQESENENNTRAALNKKHGKDIMRTVKENFCDEVDKFM